MATDMTVANTIRDQLGSVTLSMLGAYHLAGDANSLQFGIKGCRRINKIGIRLDPDDTYTIEFWRIGKLTVRHGTVSENIVKVSSYQGVYVEDMHDVIKEETGLETRL